MDQVQAALARVDAEIEVLTSKLDEVEVDVEAARARQDVAEVTELRKKVEQLRTEEEQLRTKKERLRSKELLQSEQGKPSEVLSLLQSVRELQLELKASLLEMKESLLEMKESQLQMKESQLEMKESQLEMKASLPEMKESELQMKESQLEMKASQLETKEAATVFSAALELWAGCSTTDTEREQFRAELIRHYEAAAPGGLRCMVSGCVMESSALSAACIWPVRTRNRSLATLFSLTLADLDSFRNGILMAASLEKQFSARRIAFSYDVVHDAFLFHVLDRRLNKQTPEGLNMTFEALENKALLHPPSKMPFRRLLVWHYANAVVRARSAGWLDDDALAALPRVMQNCPPGAKVPSDLASWPALARSMVDETRRASDAEDD